MPSEDTSSLHRPRWPVLASVVAVVVLLGLDVVIGPTYLGLNEPAVAVGVVLVAAMLAGSRHLLLAALVAAAASGGATWLLVGRDVFPAYADGWGSSWPGMGELAGLGLLLCWSLRLLPAVPAGLATAALGLAMAGTLERRTPTQVEDLVLLGTVLVAALSAGVGLYLRSIDTGRRRDLVRVRQDERLAIARELHDVVAHHVTGIVVQAQAAQAVWDQRPDAARAALGQIEAAGADALSSMRRLVGSLRDDAPGPRAPTAGLAELTALAERSRALGLPVRLRLDGVPDELPADLAAAVHRLVQEALTNAQRHARGATGVEVWVAADPGWLRLEVRDDGAPSQTARIRPGYGLTGMAERVHALGGTFRAGPHQDGGWVVRAELPWGGP